MDNFSVRIALIDDDRVTTKRLQEALNHWDIPSTYFTTGNLSLTALRRVLAQSQQQRTKAAKILGITPTILWRKMKKTVWNRKKPESGIRLNTMRRDIRLLALLKN